MQLNCVLEINEWAVLFHAILWFLVNRYLTICTNDWSDEFNHKVCNAANLCTNDIGCQEVGRCCTQRSPPHRSDSTYMRNIHPGLETQTRHHQKSITWSISTVADAGSPRHETSTPIILAISQQNRVELKRNWGTSLDPPMQWPHKKDKCYLMKAKAKSLRVNRSYR